jgi:hypothetical protein|tara:strand:+ start:2497 stop:3513 length:1017 start_codon:yes stop_codon:yes gene_type:complete
MAFGNRVTTTTQDFLAPKVVDTILNSNVFASRMLRAAKKWRGEQMKFPVKLSQSTNGGSFSGFDTFTTSAVDTRRNLAYAPKFFEQPVVLPLDELSANQTQEKVIGLMEVEMESSAQDMADAIGTLFYSDGTGNSSKDFLGLEAIVDDGTNAATIGGLTRASFDSLDSTVTASSGTLTLAKMATLYSDVRSGSVKPTAAYCPELVWDLYEQLLEPKLRINKDVSLSKGGLKGGTGFTALDYKGFPVLADEKATSGVLYFLNEDFIDWYGLPVANTEPIRFSSDIEGNDYSNMPGLGFSWSGWIKPTNQASIVGHVYLGGELVTTNPKRQGKLTGITGI